MSEKMDLQVWCVLSRDALPGRSRLGDSAKLGIIVLTVRTRLGFGTEQPSRIYVQYFSLTLKIFESLDHQSIMVMAHGHRQDDGGEGRDKNGALASRLLIPS